HLRIHVQRRKMRLRRRGLEMLHIRTSQRRQISLRHVKGGGGAAHLTHTSRPRITRLCAHPLTRTPQYTPRTRIQAHVTHEPPPATRPGNALHPHEPTTADQPRPCQGRRGCRAPYPNQPSTHHPCLRTPTHPHPTE